MTHPRTALERLVAPWALFAGLAAGFGACCAAGWVVSRQNLFENFERFHVFLTPYTQFYPTACQVRALAKSRLDPDKVAVLVGGDSILQGFSQRPARVWTKKLQALLGDRYQVLNLGLYGAQTHEFGATAAETLSRDYRKLILLTDLSSGCLHPAPDGLRLKYFFWDAYFKGLLLPHPERDTRLRVTAEDPNPEPLSVGRARPEGARVRTERERVAELRAEMRLDSALRFTDLWNTVGYRWVFTLWTSQTRACFTRARRYYTDDGRAGQGDTLNPGDRGASVRTLLGVLESDPTRSWAGFQETARAAFPELTRPRTLLLVMWHSPLYLRELSPEDRLRYARASRQTLRRLTALGFAAMEGGKGFRPADYVDIGHLAESGGVKLAAAVAPAVRALARRLGYEQGGGQVRP
jgi:hypothetical protein